jgi:phosphoadenosine phosphosulfate reductase
MTDPTQLSQLLAGETPGRILAAAMEAFPGAAMACSLGLEDVALVHLASQLPAPPRVFVLDTGRLPPETYDVLAALRRRYRLAIEVYFPRTEAVEAFVTEHGPNAFRDSLELRQACCRIRKVEPLARALAGAPAWITGLRRAQGPTREAIRLFEADPAHGGIIKISPLLDWSLAQVRAFVAEQHIPYNPLHDQGYPSIGCAPCTRAVAPGEDERAGRWWWEQPDHKECGLHRAPAQVAGRPYPESNHDR